MKAGGVEMRYTCLIDGRESYFFYEDNNLWSVILNRTFIVRNAEKHENGIFRYCR